jgi:hypothetical protein
MTIEIVGEGMEVPNPGGGFGTLREGAIEVTGFGPFLKRGGNGISIDYYLRFCLSLRGTNCHEDFLSRQGTR